MRVALNPKSKEVVVYHLTNGNSPFYNWLKGLRDQNARAIIRTRINRLAIGNFANTKSVGSGVFELKVDFGPDYRIYFGERRGFIIILLYGGDKSTQQGDIVKAKKLLSMYLQEQGI